MAEILNQHASDVTPTTFDLDLAAYFAQQGQNTAGPYWVSFAFWFDADPAATGVVSAWLEYTDAAGQPRMAETLPAALSDATAQRELGPVLVMRDSANSPFLLRFSLAAGEAEAAKLNYTVSAVHFGSV